MEVSVRFSSLCLLCVCCTNVGTSRGTKRGSTLMCPLSPRAGGGSGSGPVATAPLVQQQQQQQQQSERQNSFSE